MLYRLPAWQVRDGVKKSDTLHSVGVSTSEIDSYIIRDGTVNS